MKLPSSRVTLGFATQKIFSLNCRWLLSLKLKILNKKIALSEKFRPHNFKSKNFAQKICLTISNSQKFKKAILKTAIDSELDLKFADENFQRPFYVTKARKNNFVRYNFSGEQRNYAELTSQKILQNLDELRTQVSATSHFEYINREKNIQVVVIVFSLCIICRLGRMILLKIFSKPLTTYFCKKTETAKIKKATTDFVLESKIF